MIKLNLGCGNRKIKGCVNIDKRKSCEPDQCWDIEKGIPYADDSVDMVYAFDFLEHIHPNCVIFVIEEIWRVLRSGGILEHFTPSTDGRGAFQDPTHRSFWNWNSWLYYTVDEYRDLIETVAKFAPEKQIHQMTDPDNKIIHVFGRLRAVKGD